MSPASRQRLRPVAPFAAALLVVLGMFLPATGSGPLRIVHVSSQVSARFASLVPFMGPARAVESSLHRHRSHLAIARPGRVYPGLPRDFRPMPPARLGPVVLLAVTLLLIGTAGAAARLQRRVFDAALPGVRAPPVPAA